MKPILLTIPPAGIWKRDCELLDFRLMPILYFDFTKDSNQSKWRIEFTEYISFKITSEEFLIHLQKIDFPVGGSFYLIENSSWVAELGKIPHPATAKIKHYVLFFYDEVIEVIAEEMKYTELS